MPNPSKSLFYLNAYNQLKKFKFKHTLDIGCGHLDLYNNINTIKYFGIDFEDYKLKLKKRKNITFKKIDFNYLQTKTKFDLIACHEVININNYFNKKQFKYNFRKMLKLLDKNGYISINFKNDDRNHINFKDIILDHVEKHKLEIVYEFNYGLFHTQINMFAYQIIFNVIKNFQILIKMPSKQKFTYYLLKKRKL